MRVSETFFSIQGEGVNWGLPMNFVRLQGCNRKCLWCDTEQSQDPDGGREMSVDEILKELVSKRGGGVCWWYCITGGEPLMQNLLPLVEAIKGKGLFKTGNKVEIETNGTLPPPPWFSMVNTWVVDNKCPSSGVESVAFDHWLTWLRSCDQVKFVVKDRNDLDFVDSETRKQCLWSNVLISPVFPLNGGFLDEVVEFVESRNLRLSIQNHKLIGVP